MEPPKGGPFGSQLSKGFLDSSGKLNFKGTHGTPSFLAKKGQVD
jgi:hypothetical protein